MAREIEIQVTAETRQAERAFESLDDGIKRVEKDLASLEKAQEKAEKAAQKAADAAERQTQKQSALTGAVAGFLTAGAIVGAVKSTMDWAGAIADLSAKTGISTTMIQKFATAAGDSGISVERTAQSVQMMSDRLASGDKSAVTAVKALGLSMDALLKSSPDQAFLMIANAIGKIDDPMQRAKLAADLFGRSGLELTKILTRDFVDAVDKVNTVSAETIQKWDELGDTVGDLTTAGKGLIASVLEPMIPLWRLQAEAIHDAAQAMQEYNRQTPGGVLAGVAAQGTMGIPAPLYSRLMPSKNAVNAAWGLATGNIDPVTAAYLFGPTAPKGQAPGLGASLNTNDIANNPALVNAAIANLNAQAAQTAETTRQQDRLAKAAAKAAKALEAQAWRVEQLVTQDRFMAQYGGMNLAAGGWTPERGGLSVAGDLLDKWGGTARITDVMGYGGSNISPAAYASKFNWGGLGLSGLNAAMPFLSQLVTGGSRSGQIGGSLGGLAGGALGSAVSGLKGLGGFAGVLGAAAPFLGPALGIVGGLVGKLFGPSQGAILGKEADARIRQTQAGLLQQYGSVEAIAGMNESGAALAAAWGSKNVAGEAHFKNLIASFEEQISLERQIVDLEQQRAALIESLIPTYRDVTEAANVLGINVEGLGPKVAQLGANESWAAVINALDTIIAATGDVGGSLEQASGKISAMVQQAIKAGTEIPANMRPYIEELIRSGKLLDENGAAITDMTQIKFGDAIKTQAEIVNTAIDGMTTSIDKFATRLEEIIRMLGHDIPNAAEAASGAVNGVPSGERPEVAMAAGGIVTRPTVALIGERGPEVVIPLSRVNSGRPPIVQVILDGRVLAESMMRHQADLLPQFGV